MHHANLLLENNKQVDKRRLSTKDMLVNKEIMMETLV